MKINIQHIAKLANIPLKKEEEEKLEKQLSSILDHIKKLEEVDTSVIPDTNNITGLINIMKDDSVVSSLSQKEAASNAKNIHNGFFKVKAILEG